MAGALRGIPAEMVAVRVGRASRRRTLEGRKRLLPPCSAVRTVVLEELWNMWM